jgi:Glycosyl transferase family 11
MCARTWNPQLNLLFFVGGGFHRKDYEEDRFWVRERLMTKALEGDTVFIAPEELSHMTVMYALTRCDHLVISSSTFSWWAGYLSEQATTIIAPRMLLVDTVPFKPEDHYPPHWILLDKNSPPPNYQYNYTKRPHIKPWLY